MLIMIAATAAAAVGDITLHDGQDAAGEIIVKIEATANATRQANFFESVYCQGGLFADVGSDLTGALVVWRDEPYK